MARAQGDLTPAALRVLRLLLDLESREGDEDAEPAEIVCEGLACWVGATRTSPALVRRLVAGMLVGDASDEGGLVRLRLTPAGRLVAAGRRDVAARLVAGLAGAPVAVTDDGVVTLDAYLNHLGRAPRG